MSLNFGSPYVPRTKQGEIKRFAMNASAIAVPIIALTNWNACPAIANLPLFMVVWFALKFVADFIEMWYNIPQDMGEKTKLLESGEHPGAKLVCGIKDFISIGFLVFSIVSFIIIAPEISEWGGGDDQVTVYSSKNHNINHCKHTTNTLTSFVSSSLPQCNSGLFTAATMCFGIPTLIACGLVFYGLFLLVKSLVKGKEDAGISVDLKGGNTGLVTDV